MHSYAQLSPGKFVIVFLSKDGQQGVKIRGRKLETAALNFEKSEERLGFTPQHVQTPGRVGMRSLSGSDVHK